MTCNLFRKVLILFIEFFTFLSIHGVSFINDNSSERRTGIYEQAFGTREERWATIAYDYVHNLNCKEVFFTTFRECKDLVEIKKSKINIHVALPSKFGGKYRTTLPDEQLTGADTHDAVLIVDPYPNANFGHLVIVFYIDENVAPLDCKREEGIYLGSNECMTLALRRRCKNVLERRSRRRNFARRCEINFLPVVHFDKDVKDDLYMARREDQLQCMSDIPGFASCPELRTVNETAELVCNPIRDNTQRCSTTHETVHTSCRIFEVCDQAVILSGGWNRQTTGVRHLRNVELFYWTLRKNGFKRKNIKIFFANGVSGVKVPGEDPHQVQPAALKLALRYHIQTLCSSRHCVDSLMLYFNSPSKSDGTSLLWDINNDGIADDSERYTLNELKSDLARCEARQVHLIIDQSYAGEIAVAFQGSSRHKNVVVFASGKDHEYSFDDEYTSHWVQANHKRTCTNEVHENSLNSIKNSSPIMQEGEPGTVRTTIFGAPCNVVPPFTEHELRENYYGCQNLPTGFWLMKAVDERKRKR